MSKDFIHIKEIKNFAIQKLNTFKDEELRLYLLQLVETMRYENSKGNELVSFLLKRAENDLNLCVDMYWFLKVNSKISNEIFKSIFKKFKEYLKKKNVEYFNIIANQKKLINSLYSINMEIKNIGNRELRKKRFYQLIENFDLIFESNDGENRKRNFFVIDPNIKIKKIIKEECSLFKSNTVPMKIGFENISNLNHSNNSSDNSYIIFKIGDDLRQDQLVLQLMTLMNHLLLDQNVDLKLLTYKIIPTGIDQGIIQYIQSNSLTDIINQFGTIREYLKHLHPDDSSPFGISSQIFDNYIRSCAGSCVLTYLFGVGDRHLQNILIANNGILFHIDFAYLLGNDPKIFPPPMKLSKEMVDAMGGQTDPIFSFFKSLCFTAFNILRKKSHLILSLFSIMSDSELPIFSINKEKAIQRFEESFVLNFSDEEAINHFEEQIDISIKAFMAPIFDWFHDNFQKF